MKLMIEPLNILSTPRSTSKITAAITACQFYITHPNHIIRYLYHFITISTLLLVSGWSLVLILLKAGSTIQIYHQHLSDIS